jgi:hypothetical protein
MLTIFALPKPFNGHFGVIQRNAISQWARLRPRPEILLFGDEEGTAEIAQEFALRHIPEVTRNQYGTPLLNDFFEKAHTLASNKILCYVNSDIILHGDFMGAVQRVASSCDRFLMVGQRTNVDLDEPAIYESSDQEARLRALVAKQGRLGPATSIDYFVFPRGHFSSFPPFAIGRPWWDNWFLWKARASKIPLVDASQIVFAVHQNHDYSHLPPGSQGAMQCEEARQNRRLAGWGFCTIEDATHKLTTDGIKCNPQHFFAPTKRRTKNSILYWWYEFLRITGPVRHPLGLRQEKIARVLGSVRLPTNR